MNKKLILILLAIIFVLTAAACSNNAVKGSNTASEKATEVKSTNIQDVKNQDDKIIQEAIDTMDNLKLDEINDGILNDSELDSILKDKDDPISDIPTK
jgi:hypothetical protein